MSTTCIAVSSQGAVHSRTTCYYCENVLIICRNNVPTHTTVQKLITFEKNRLVGNVKSTRRPRTDRSVENIAAASESVAESQGTSIRV